VIQLESVSKRFGGQIALRDVSLTLTGSVALIGPNGSGKTTLLRLLATLIKCDSGRITWHGIGYSSQIRLLRQRIGYLPQHIELPGDLTPRLLLQYLTQIRQMADQARSDLLLSALRLERVANMPLSALSGGQLRLVCLAQAVLSQPEILILDEVFNGLGIEERQLVTRLLTVENTARLMVFSTQSPEDARRLAERVVILKGGSVSFCGKLNN
jgi:ABC-2 type transport system ATP-binding protein